ncbi:MAG: hypothetical protein K8T89_16905 [Planctomycetes bacterium]|nr:hypothetical protein [Planctomycetota bacterium]
MADKVQKSVSKMEAVRQAIATLGADAMPVDIQSFVKKNMGHDMSTAHVSNYKTEILRKQGAKKAPKVSATKSAVKKPAAKPADAPAPVAAAPRVKAEAVSIQDIQAVKGLVGRVGEQNLKSLIDLLGK